MAITVTEREHWKARIEKRIDMAIESVYSAKEPGLLERIKAQANRQAAELLGIASLTEQREQISREAERLKRNDREVVRQMVATIRDCDVREIELDSYYGNIPCEVNSAINRRAALCEQDLLAEHPLGRQILSLRREKEELLDTVWLATSGRQIKELWSQVIHRLDQQPTVLQSEALKIPPEESGDR